jgi:hypothetical protein
MHWHTTSCLNNLPLVQGILFIKVMPVQIAGSSMQILGAWAVNLVCVKVGTI